MPRTLLRRPLALLVVLAVMTAIFLLDTFSDYAVAAACFYAALILAVSRRLRPRLLAGLALACVVLTVASFLLTRTGAYRIGLVNTAIGILVIGITTYLALQMEAARAAVHEAQTRLLRVARLSTVGELTTSIAHEVNQPLAAIASSAEAGSRWLAQNPPNVHRAQQALQRVAADAHRASEVIARVRGLTRGAVPMQSVFDLNQAVQDMLALSQAELERQQIHVATLYDPALPTVWADRVQVQQVIGNLLLNAIEAMADTPLPERRLSVLTQARDQRVRLSVRDRGIGLPADGVEQVFDAFWTTKTEGLGLGLSLSRSMLEANGGHIHAERSSGGGACFIVDLPAAEETGHAPRPAR